MRWKNLSVGLLYRKGYMRQRLRGGVEQEAMPEPLDLDLLALEPVRDDHGDPVEVVLHFPASALRLRAWRAPVGRVSLYLLDADVPSNRPEHRQITQVLYEGGQDSRIRQEMVLGMGGVRLLEQLGITPSVYHVNEGHGAFVGLERMRQLIADTDLSFEQAQEVVRATTVFTTHTPVPAGHDEFSEDLVRRYFSDAPNWIGLPWEKFFALGSSEQDLIILHMRKLQLIQLEQLRKLLRR